MANNTLNDLHFEFERSISRRVVSKLIGYQVSLSVRFYDQHTKFWNKKYSLKFPDLNDCVYPKKKELSDF